MSKHDHPHDHDHGHDHDHHHHDHGHSHSDKGLNAVLEERIAAKQTGGGPEPVITPEADLEDSGSRALTDALKSSFFIVKALMVVLVLVFLGSGFFTVPGNERAIILRFGRPVGNGADQLKGPGAHWSFPSPIDEVVRIPIGEAQTVTSTAGWFAVTPEQEAANQLPDPMPSLNPAADGYTLTADANIIHVRATLTYRITDPLAYALNFVNTRAVLQNTLNNAIAYASARHTADQAVRLDVLGFRERVLARVRELIDAHGLGVAIDQADVRAIPPRYIAGAFEEVLRAELDRRKAISDAQAYSNRVITAAGGEADAVLNKGREDRTRMIAEINADAEAFKNQLPYYRQNQRLFMARLQTERLQNILTNVDEKTFLPTRGDGKRELRLNIGRDLTPAAQPENPEQQGNR
ncbi:MAG TPA: protease modulator HflK [Methylomirabilota bacterium]|nr:protease modulator HflK [Methylomirabilota bacterium]